MLINGEISPPRCFIIIASGDCHALAAIVVLGCVRVILDLLTKLGSRLDFEMTAQWSLSFSCPLSLTFIIIALTKLSTLQSLSRSLSPCWSPLLSFDCGGLLRMLMYSSCISSRPMHYFSPWSSTSYSLILLPSGTLSLSARLESHHISTIAKPWCRLSLFSFWS